MRLLQTSHLIPLLLLLVCLTLGGWTAFAESNGGTYQITRFTVETGGLATSGDFALKGTSGQPDAATSANGIYTLMGGFWGGHLSDFDIFLPLMINQP